MHKKMRKPCTCRELFAEITENPYLQYFIGLPAYRNKAPFVPSSLLVEFRKRLTEEILGEINEMIIDFNTEKEEPKDPDDNSSNGQGSGTDDSDNEESDENGMTRLERISFDAYNEYETLQGAIERYHERTGRYPERVLVDKIYRNRENLAYCNTKLDMTTRSSIALSIIVMNVEQIISRMKQCLSVLADKESKLLAETAA